MAGNPIQYLYAFNFSDGDQTNRDFIRSFIDSIPNGFYILRLQSESSQSIGV